MPKMVPVALKVEPVSSSVVVVVTKLVLHRSRLALFNNLKLNRPKSLRLALVGGDTHTTLEAKATTF